MKPRSNRVFQLCLSERERNRERREGQSGERNRERREGQREERGTERGERDRERREEQREGQREERGTERGEKNRERREGQRETERRDKEKMTEKVKKTVILLSIINTCVVSLFPGPFDKFLNLCLKNHLTAMC